MLQFRKQKKKKKSDLLHRNIEYELKDLTKKAKYFRSILNKIIIFEYFVHINNL